MLGVALICTAVFALGGFTVGAGDGRNGNNFLYSNPDTHWNILGVVVRHVDVEVAGGRAQISMSARDVAIAEERFLDLGRTLGNMSNGQMTASVSILHIHTPLTQMGRVTTTMGTYGYAPRPHHIMNLVADYINIANFCHVMTFMRTQCDLAAHSVPTRWMGLYNGVVDDIHFSQVLFSPSRYCTWHTANFFPELVLVHEFIHGLERRARELGVSIPSSIDAPRENYGYGMSRQDRFRFYYDFMNRNISHNGNFIGLTPEVFVRRTVVTLY